MGIIAFHTVINMYFFLNQYVALFQNCTEISGLGHNDNNHVSKNIASFSILTFKFVYVQPGPSLNFIGHGTKLLGLGHYSILDENLSALEALEGYKKTDPKFSMVVIPQCNCQISQNVLLNSSRGYHILPY